MSHGVKVRVWGELALFSRPEIKGRAVQLRCDDTFSSQGDSGSNILASGNALGG